MPFTDLPYEIIVVVLQTAVDATAIPSDIFCVCRLFYHVGIDYLYTHPSFTSAHQLHQFALAKAPQPPIAPRSLVVDLTGKAQRGVHRHLCDALVKCRQLSNAATGALPDAHPAGLKRLRLRMHSYSQDSAVDLLEQGLQAIRDCLYAFILDIDQLWARPQSPDMFEWTGPDPDHHFSTAIIAPVATCLFKQFSSWCNIREIVVTNISFSTGAINQEEPFPPLLGDIPSLRYLYIGQATFLQAQAVAGMLCQGRMVRLGAVRLVDAYSESIWGPRLRRSDIERAAMMLCRTEEQAAVIARVKRVVRCEKKTERIIGGDRVDGTHILE